jgi:Xaa-Pro aminopeptidase
MGVVNAGKTGFETVLITTLLDIARAEGVRTRAEFMVFLLARFAPGEKSLTVPRSFPLDMADHLRLHGFVVDVRHPFFPERAVKTDEEIDAMRHTAACTVKGFERIEKILGEAGIEDGLVTWQGAPLTSEWLKEEVEIAFVRAGVADVEGMIISSGPHAAIPHHKGEGRIRAGESIVCDLFPLDRRTGYFADLTRTYVKGAPSPRLQAMFDAVKEAQARAMKAVRPGAAAREIDGIVRHELGEGGFDTGDKGFTHSTGHGVGLEVHEAPSVGERSTDTLQPGHIITVEPGLYYPEHGGIRIEDMVLVTEMGHELLVEHPSVFAIA